LNYTLSLGNQSILINYSSGFVHVWGEVINVTFISPFKVDLGVVKCDFHPFTTPHLETTKYQMVCDFDYNITEDERYVPIPLSMLKSFEDIQAQETNFQQRKFMFWFWESLAIVVSVVFAAYLFYNEVWIYRED